jgi:uncharacterized protein (TIGR02266 family)
MDNKEIKSVLVADLPGPERDVLSAVLDRLGYQVESADTVEDMKGRLEGSTPFHVVILRSKMAGDEEGMQLARTLGQTERRVILISDEPPPGGEMVGFVDITENALLAMGVRVPEVIFAVNDLIFSRKGVPRRKRRIYGGFPASYKAQEDWITGGIYNLSSEGAFIETRDPPSTGSEILVRFTLPGHEGMELKSRVTWRVEASQTAGRRSPPGMGVQFLNPTEEEDSKIREFVKSGGRQ